MAMYQRLSKNMSKELIFPLYAHQIYIDDCITSDERAVTFAKNIQKCPTIYADVHINENGTYFAVINDLKNLCCSSVKK